MLFRYALTLSSLLISSIHATHIVKVKRSTCCCTCAPGSVAEGVLVSAAVQVVVQTVVPVTYTQNGQPAITTITQSGPALVSALATQGADGQFTAVNPVIVYTATPVAQSASATPGPDQISISVQINVGVSINVIVDVPTTLPGGAETINQGSSNGGANVGSSPSSNGGNAVGPVMTSTSAPTVSLPGMTTSATPSSSATRSPIFTNSTMSSSTVSATSSQLSIVASTPSATSGFTCPTASPTLVLQVFDPNNNFLGYISNTQNVAGNFGPLVQSTTAALRVGPVARAGAAVSDGRFSLLSTNSQLSPQFPYLGAIRALDNENPPGFRTFSTTSGNFADLGGTLMNDGNPADSDGASSSRNAVDNNGGNNESPIWSFTSCATPSTFQLTASWENDDLSIFNPAIIVLSTNQGQPNLIITGNAQTYGSREDTAATDVVVKVVPVAVN